MAMMPNKPMGEPDGDEGMGKPKAQPAGPGSATQPTVNNGEQAASMAMLAPLVRQMEQILPRLGSGSEAGAALLKAISSLSKFAAPAEASPGIAMNAAQNIMNRLRQEGPMIAAMRGQGGGAPQGQPAPVQAPPQV